MFSAQKRYANIHAAVSAGDVNALETMVKAGASINEVDERDKFTPLHSACNAGALEVNCHNFVNTVGECHFYQVL